MDQPEPEDSIPQLGPLSPRDYSRRTQLANERTFLAWWRTGLASLTVALAAARVVPELAKPHAKWPYTVIGLIFAVLGVVCILAAEERRRAVDAAIRRGEFAEPRQLLMTIVVGLGAIAGLAICILIVVDG